MSYSHDFKFFERLTARKVSYAYDFEKDKNLSQEKCLILWRPPSFKITNQGYSGICLYRKFLYHCNYFHMVGYHSTLQCSDEYICMSYLNQGFKIDSNFWLILCRLHRFIYVQKFLACYPYSNTYAQLKNDFQRSFSSSSIWAIQIKVSFTQLTNPKKIGFQPASATISKNSIYACSARHISSHIGIHKV